jgi:two-component system sensor histidine kinase GlrK
MRFYYPRSFLKLLFAGFALIALPLIFALINTAISVDQLANRSQRAVYQAVQATQSSRRLAELLTAMERSARQMIILGDRALLESYELNRKQFLTTAQEFSVLPFDNEQMDALEVIVRSEAAIYAVLLNAAADAVEQKKVVADFVRMADQAQVITMRSNELINREVEAMRATAAQAQRITLWQLLALVPVMVFLVIGFAILIARPIRQLDAAIRRLGGGEFNMPVEVSGPDDLQFLGERLEWMRRRLIELEQQKNRLLRQVSHELKTPLTALREGAELLSDEVVGKLSPEQREIAEILRHNSIELQKLIEDLLSYGASQFHKVALVLKPLSIRQIVNRVVDDQKLAIRAKDLKLENGVDDVTVAADFEKLRVVVDNLMSNAIKYSPQGGSLAVSARRAGGCLELDVADSGPGIAAEDIPHIFDPFYQGRNNAAGLVHGTGIGLSIVKEFVSAHGGSVEVVQDAPQRDGNGVLMRVKLPLIQARDAAG